MRTSFMEGEMVAEKDFHAPKHFEHETIANLQVKEYFILIYSYYYCLQDY